MHFEVSDVDSVKKKITVELDPKELIDIESEVVKDIQKNATIPGFRKGKIPPGLVRKTYKELIETELQDKAVNKYYSQIITQVDFKPVSYGSITDIRYESMEKGMAFDVEVDVEPEIELKTYKGLTVEKEIPEITDDMVAHQLTHLQEKFATVKNADTAAEGHHIVFDAQELGEGDVPVVGRKYEDLQVKIGSGDFNPEMEEQMVGLGVAQDAIVRHSAPSPEDENQTVVNSLKINIKSIEERELPPLDDELAKNLQDEEIESLDSLKQRLLENLEFELDTRSQRQFRQRLIDELLKENPFDVPESMVNHHLDHIIENLKSRNPDQPLDESMIRQNYRPEAIYALRWYMLKERLLEVENIEVSEEELFERIEETSYNDGVKAEMKKDAELLSKLKDEVTEEKLINFLADNAVVTEIKPQAPETAAEAPETAESSPIIVSK